jgi:hypothetical protein
MGAMRVLAMIVSIVSFAGAGAGHAETQFPFLHGGNKPMEYETYQSPAGSFSIEYPKKDWKVGASGLTVLAQFTYKSGPVTVLVEQKVLDGPWVDSDTTDLTAETLTTNLKTRFPNAASFTHEIRKSSRGSVVIVEFTKPSSAGTGSEKCRFYYRFSGSALYTIECEAPSDLFPKYADVFEHMANSFTVGVRK